MQLASRNPQDRLLLIREFLARLTGPLPSRCTLTFAHSFAELSRNFRKNIPICRPPDISKGLIRGKASTRGLGVWLSQSLTFGTLAAAFGACFLRLQKATLGSTSGRCKDVPMKGKANVRYHSPCRTPGRQEVVALNKL